MTAQRPDPAFTATDIATRATADFGASTTASHDAHARDRKKRKESVKHLFVLYTIVCALALEDGLKELFLTERALDPSVALLVLAFVATLIPFFHGALRHVDDYYCDHFPKPVRPAGLAIDFLFLFLQAVCFFALATHIGRPSDSLPATYVGRTSEFLSWWLVLLGIDVAWGVAMGTRILCPYEMSLGEALRGFLRYLGKVVRLRSDRRFPELSWAYNNAVFLIGSGAGVLAALVSTGAFASPSQDRLTGLAALTCALAMARTTFDYALNWGFYFPGAKWQDALHAVYERTTYVARITEDEELRIRVGERNVALDAFLDQRQEPSWAFVTAWNPKSELLPPAENHRRQRLLEEALERKGYWRCAGHGVPDQEGWEPEESQFVVGINAEEAIALGAQFGQYAVVVGRRGGVPHLRDCLPRA